MIIQPQFVGDPRPHESVLRWTRGVRQPSDPGAAELFVQQSRRRTTGELALKRRQFCVRRAFRPAA